MIVRILLIALLAGASNAFVSSIPRRCSTSLFAGDYLDDMSSSQPSDDDKPTPDDDIPQSDYLEDLALSLSHASDDGSDISDISPSDAADDDDEAIDGDEPASAARQLSTPPLESVDVDVDQTIMTLLQIGASTGRGEFAKEDQKQKAADLISAIELQNPAAEPSKSPLISGRWELVYSSTQLFRSSPFFMAGRAVCSTPEQAKQYDWFCDMHRQALAISTIGQVRQIVSPTRLVSEFEVKAGAIPFLNDLTPFSYSGGLPVSYS